MLIFGAQAALRRGLAGSDARCLQLLRGSALGREQHTVSHVRLTPQGVEILKNQSDGGEAAPDADGQSTVPRPEEDGPPPLLCRLQGAVLSQVRATFLPVGYPASVRPGYLSFMGWQAANHVAASANGVLASAGLLYGLGYGSESAAAAGALSWVLKDGLGQLGTLVFGRFIAQDFDVHARRWYLAASVKLDVAVLLELSTMLASVGFFLPAASTANGLKGLAWMAGGSARAVFNNSFAKRANLADVTAKATSQAICAGLLGTAGGIALAAAMGQGRRAHAAGRGRHQRRAPGHQLAQRAQRAPRHTQPGPSARAGRRVCRGPRARRARRAQPGDELPPDLGPLLALSRPDESAAVEPLVPAWGTAIPVGVSPARLRRLPPARLRDRLLPAYGGARHMLVDGADIYAYSARRRRHGYRRLLLHERATTDDVLLGCLHHCLARADEAQDAAQRVWRSASLETQASEPSDAAHVGAVRRQLSEARRLFPAFKAALLAAGWDSHQLKVENTRHRAIW
ncbi:hypothetical protein QBZ16_005326 [Prototheca wickerhamii]|uniref:Uncharacterized protein n=1 Tax=Prototheca wickerhamii TaxID=3111 RepID=A0AAD9IE43_PROWI|nr:hypothetical protein QBZ16_005326 [Prototheca wickerhamii]